jgi:hypothetical protein
VSHRTGQDALVKVKILFLHGSEPRYLGHEGRSVATTPNPPANKELLSKKTKGVPSLFTSSSALFINNRCHETELEFNTTILCPSIYRFYLTTTQQPAISLRLKFWGSTGLYEHSTVAFLTHNRSTRNGRTSSSAECHDY